MTRDMISKICSNRKLKKLEANVASLLENAAVDKKYVSSELQEIRSSVASVKKGLGAEIDRLAVSCIQILFSTSYSICR